MRRCSLCLACVFLVLLMVLSGLGVVAAAGGAGGVGGTLVGLSNDRVYELFDTPKFVESGDDGKVYNFEEWAAYSTANPTEQGYDGIIDVKNQVIIRYYIGYTPDYSKGRFTPGFLVSDYRAEADKYIRLEDLPAYCSDVAGIAKATAVYIRPAQVRNLGAQVTGAVISYVVESESLTGSFGTAYAGKSLVVSVRVLDGETLGYPGERLVDSYSVSIVGADQLSGLGERVDQ